MNETIKQLIDAAQEGNVLSVKEGAISVLAAKAIDAFAARKEAIAQSYFGGTVDPITEGKDFTANREELTESNTFAKPELHSSHALIHEPTGKEITMGSVMKDFRGDKHKVTGFELPHHSGSSGRVFTKHGPGFKHDGYFFPGVVDARIVKREKLNADKLETK